MHLKISHQKNYNIPKDNHGNNKAWAVTSAISVELVTQMPHNNRIVIVSQHFQVVILQVTREKKKKRDLLC